MKSNKKINIHVFPTDMQQAARTLKIAHTIDSLGLFDHIFILGINKNGLLPETEKIKEKVTVIRLPIDSKNWISKSLFGKVFPILKFWIHSYRFMINKKPTVINAHNLVVLPPCVLFKIFNKTKIVYDTHELETQRQGWKNIEIFISNIFERICIKFVDKIVVVSKPIGDWYKKRYKINPIVVNNVPQYHSFKNSNYLSEKFNIEHDRKIFIFIGVLSKGRGIQQYLEYFEETKLNICIVFLGGGPLEGTIKKYAKNSKKIYFHNNVPFNEVNNVVSSADYSLSILRIGKPALSYEYMMPNKLFESIMAGIPVLSGGMKYEAEFVKKHNIGDQVYSVDSNYKFEKSIKNILSLDYNELQKNCKKLSKKYNWENQELEIKKYMNDCF